MNEFNDRVSIVATPVYDRTISYNEHRHDGVKIFGEEEKLQTKSDEANVPIEVNSLHLI